MLRIFTSVKIERLRPGLNPQTWVPEASMLTTRPPKPSCPYPKVALVVKVTSQTRVSVVLAISISIMLPPYNFGFPKQITDKCCVQNYRNS